MADKEILKSDYITMTGPESIRYGANRELNLTNFLPNMYRGTDVETFTQFFEEFLNTMFDGVDGFNLSNTEIAVTKNYTINPISGTLRNDTYSFDSKSISADANNVQEQLSTLNSDNTKISILERIYRITELHDPDLIDIEYIQYFAKNLGYNLDVYRNEAGGFGTELGNLGELETLTIAADINRYLRFMVSNLPHWYKIKTSDNAIKVMLYSFGLVGDIIKYYTDSYDRIEAGGKWTADLTDDLSQIPTNYFSTPHYAIKIMIDESVDIIADIEKRSSVIRAIESIKPINNVFRRLMGYINRTLLMQIRCNVRLQRYIRIRD